VPRQDLYAYVDGADIEDIATRLEKRFAAFVGTHRWISGRARVVNQKHGEETCSQPIDIPLWHLGLNLEIPDIGAEPPGWFADVEAIAEFLGRLFTETGRTFVIGVAAAGTGHTCEDLFYVSSATPDIGKLRTAFGV